MKKNTKCCFGYCTYCIGRKGTQRRTLERGILLDDGYSYDKVEMVKLDTNGNPTNETYVEYKKVYEGGIY
jgi:hypothetical protein